MEPRGKILEAKHRLTDTALRYMVAPKERERCRSVVSLAFSSLGASTVILTFFLVTVVIVVIAFSLYPVYRSD